MGRATRGSSRLISITIITISTALAGACSTNTPIKRSALVPTAHGPSRMGRPLENLEVRGAFQGNPIMRLGSLSSGFFVDSGDVGDAGLWIPITQLGASLSVGLSRYFELGAQALVATLDMSDSNVSGVESFPADQRNRVMALGGASLRANIPLGRSRATLSFIAELNWARVHQTVFVCETQPCLPIDGHAEYETVRVEHRTKFMPSLFLHLGGDLGRRWHLFGLVGVQPQIRNLGFDPDLGNLPASTLQRYPVGIAGIGGEFRVRRFFISAAWIYPVEFQDDIHFGVSLMLQLGVRLGRVQRAPVRPRR